MAYIGKTPVVGNFQVCDAISVVNGQAAYTMQINSTNVEPESANHMLVSLNGILQKPGSSYTISGSTITFASNLATGDVIDFITLLGNVLDIGQPSDDTVTAAKLNNDIISGQTALTSSPADTDELLISDAGTIKRIDVSLVGGKNTPYFQAVQSSDVSLSANTATVISFNSEPFDSGSLFNNSNGRFVMDSTNAGKYFIYAKVSITSDATYDSSGKYMEIKLNHYNSSDSSLFDHSARFSYSQVQYPTAQVGGFFNLANGDYVNVTLKVTDSSLLAFGVNTTSPSKLEFTGFKIIE